MGQVIKVEEVMGDALETISGLATVREALDRMRVKNISSLVIDRRHDGDEYGVVTCYDIAEKVIAENRSVDRTSVYEIMTKPALTVAASMNIKYAIRLLARLNAGRALVLRDNKVVGLVNLRDMVVRYVDDGEKPA